MRDFEKTETLEARETAETAGAERREPPASTRQRVLMLLVAAVVIILDQFSKFIVESTLPLNQSWAPIAALEPVFRITHVSNTGTAFGLFQNGSALFAWVAVIVALVLLYYNYTLPSGHMALRLALGLQLGGALGNLIDRVRLGHVTDFLDFSYWPVFNVADTSIVTGAILLGWLMWREQKHSQPHEAPANANEPARKPGPIDEWSAN